VDWAWAWAWTGRGRGRGRGLVVVVVVDVVVDVDVNLGSMAAPSGRGCLGLFRGGRTLGIFLAILGPAAWLVLDLTGRYAEGYFADALVCGGEVAG
jgi:hypothetical protein